jgi:hypothetical protein
MYIFKHCLVLSQITSNLCSILIEITVCSYEHVQKHKVNSIEYHSVCPLVGIVTRPPPFLQAIVPPPRNQRVGDGGGGPIPTTGEKFSTLPTLCTEGFIGRNCLVVLLTERPKLQTIRGL